MPAEVFYYISKINKSSACAACLMLARGGCAVLNTQGEEHHAEQANCLKMQNMMLQKKRTALC